MVTSKDMKFIVIDKQKDLPTELEMLGRLHGATKLEEFIMPNGDIIVASKDIKLNAPDIPVNLKATEMYNKEAIRGNCPDIRKQTGYKETIRGHCYLIKKNVKY